MVKRRGWIIPLLAAGLLLSGCTQGQVEYITVDIPAQVEEMRVSCFSGGGEESWVITQPDIDAVRAWAGELACSTEPVKENPSPGDLNGGVSYHFSYKTPEGEREFSYLIAGEDESYLHMDTSWYPATNPVMPPVALATEDDPWGIWMQVVSASSSGVKIVCKQSGGEATGDLQTGSPYLLQMYTDSGWVDLTHTTCIRIEGDWGWTMEAWLIPKNESVEWTVDWTWIYGELPDGRYRIGKEIMDFRGPGDYDERVYWAEFEITDGANELSDGEAFASVCRRGSDAVCVLTKKDADLLRHLLERGTWDEGATADCLNDCSLFFAADWDNIAYHSECGTFNDTQKQRSLTLSEEDRGVVNAVLGKYIALDLTLEIF